MIVRVLLSRSPLQRKVFLTSIRPFGMFAVSATYRPDISIREGGGGCWIEMLHDVCLAVVMNLTCYKYEVHAYAVSSPSYLMSILCI